MSNKRKLQTLIKTNKLESATLVDLFDKLSNTTITNLLKDLSVTNEIDDSEDIIRVFTDGGALKNGKKGAKAGYAIYFDNFEYSSLLEQGMPQTNNYAELYAIMYALKKLIDGEKASEKIVLYSDSEYSIKCINTWSKAWKKNNWLNAKGQPVKNKELIQQILELVEDFDNLSFKHVFSHLPEPPNKNTLEWTLWNGNNICDLAIQKHF